jgi:hypothetical protein
MFVPLARSTTGTCLNSWRLRHKTSAWASGGPAGGRHVAERLGRWRALPQHGPPRRVQLPHIRWIAFLSSEIRSGPIAVPDRLRCSRGGCFSPVAVSAESPLWCASSTKSTKSIFCSKLRAPRRGTSLGPFVCGLIKIAYI